MRTNDMFYQREIYLETNLILDTMQHLTYMLFEIVDKINNRLRI